MSRLACRSLVEQMRDRQEVCVGRRARWAVRSRGQGGRRARQLACRCDQARQWAGSTQEVSRRGRRSRLEMAASTWGAASREDGGLKQRLGVGSWKAVGGSQAQLLRRQWRRDEVAEDRGKRREASCTREPHENYTRESHTATREIDVCTLRCTRERERERERESAEREREPRADERETRAHARATSLGVPYRACRCVGVPYRATHTDTRTECAMELSGKNHSCGNNRLQLYQITPVFHRIANTIEKAFEALIIHEFLIVWVQKNL